MNRDMDKFGLTEKLLHFMVEEVDRMRDVLNDLGALSPKKPAKRKVGRPKGSKNGKPSNNS